MGVPRLFLYMQVTVLLFWGERGTVDYPMGLTTIHNTVVNFVVIDLHFLAFYFSGSLLTNAFYITRRCRDLRALNF